MNKREAAIITAYTGILIGCTSTFHKYVGEKFGHSLLTYEFGSTEFWEKLKQLSRDDFLKLNKKVISSEWTSVKDNLPKKSKKVLVWVKYKRRKTGGIGVSIFDDNSKSRFESCTQSYWFTHWMPQPEPPHDK